MALDFKTVSQRNWVKGLQATYDRFSQPPATLARLSNLLYDSRGALRTTDGSLIVTEQDGEIQPAAGPLTEMFLFSPVQVNRYYVGIQKSYSTQLPDTASVTAAGVTVGGSGATATRYNGITKITLTAHGLPVSNSAFNNYSFLTGTISLGSFSDATIDTSIDMSLITVIDADHFSFVQAGANTTATGGLVAPLNPLPNGAYTYVICAADGAGGQTTGTTGTVTTSGSENAVSLTWPAVTNAAGYSGYGTALAHQGEFNPNASNFILGNAWMDLNLFNNSSQPPPQNTTQQCIVWRMDYPSYTVQIGVLPADNLPNTDTTGGGRGGGGGVPAGGQTGGAGAGPQGGVPNNISPLPQMVQFANKLIIAPGNGYPPQEYSNGGTLIPIPNNFTSQYPDWQASVAWNQGDQIRDSVSGGIFTAQQGGSSGGSRPTFVNVVGKTTADNNIIWICTATSYTGTSLRGAAHCIVYAGSLWIANTWPYTTSDNIDGPSCIKMSDVNNPESWNPVNVAFLGKDDGDQITGMATFTVAEAGIAPTGSLVVFKNFATYQLIGVFGASDFSIQQAQTDLGCIAPRSIQFVPGFGIMRLTHLGIAYFNGVNDKLISEDIRPYLFGGEDDIVQVDWNYAYFSKGAQAADPPMYLLACPLLAPLLSGVTFTPGSAPATSPFTIYAVMTKLTLLPNGEYEEVAISNESAIVSETNSFYASSPPIEANVLYRIYVGTVSGGENLYIQQVHFTNIQLITVASLTNLGSPSIGYGALTRIFCYDLVLKVWTVVDLPFSISVLKQFRAPGTIPITGCGGFNDGTFRRLFSGDLTWDGDPINWDVRPAEVFQEGGSGKVFYRRLIVRAQTESSETASIGATVNLQGNPSARPISKVLLNNGTQQQLELTVDILRDAQNASVDLAGQGPVRIESIDWYIKPKPAGAPVSAQR